MNVLIISSSREEIDDYYKSIARSLSHYLASNNCNLIFGGASTSMMGICYQEFDKQDRIIYAYTTPKYLEDLKNIKNAKQVICTTTFELKKRMFENSDLIVCLPGGIGTISELLSFIEEKRSNDKDVPILIYDENNYYKELFDMINKSINNRFTDNSIYREKRKNKMNNITMEKLVNFCKQYGFIFQGSEIYGGLANTWDYGPLGSRLKNNIKDAWRKRFIQERKNAYEVDADILMHPRVWEASGHVASFSDPLADCKECKTRHRVDNLINDYSHSSIGDSMTQEEMMNYIRTNKVPCPKCGKSNFTDIRQFNLMFATQRGVTTDAKNTVYLRPENAQGEYVNFLNVQRTMRAKLPFSIGQIGKAFRNEITPGNFTFRTIEFEQMEYQTFCKEGTDSEIYNYFKDYGKKFFMDLGLPNDKLRFHDHEKLAHYAKEACDIEYLFPFGWGEINGTHNRTNFDLTRHQEYSGIAQTYLDPETNEKYIPYIIESTYGLDRTVLAVLFNAYNEETLEDGTTREVLKLHPYLSPYKVNVLPLIKKMHSEKALEIYEMLSKHFMVSYDDSGNIGKRYRRGDVVGTPFAITVDDETINNGTVTVRDRDTMEQITIKVDELANYIKDKILF